MTPVTFTSALRKWRWTIAAVFIALSALAYFAVPWALGPKVSTVAVTNGNVVQTLVASGTIANPNRVEISSQISGSIIDVLVNEGQFVAEGQPMIRLDDTELQSTMAQAVGAVEVANAKLRQLRETALPSARQSLDQAQATLVQTQLQFDRISTLHGARVVADVTLDAAVHDLAQAKAAVISAALAVKTLEPEGSDYSSTQSALEQAQANVRGVQAKMSYLSILAPSSGTVITRSVEPGSVVQPGKVLMVLSPVGKSEVTVLVDERNLGLIMLGQSALVSADAFPDLSFNARLTYIQPSIDPNRGSVQAKLDVLNPPKFLIQDMTVSVDIEVAKRTNVFLAPVSAIHDLLTKKPWVLIVDRTRALRQEVTLGVKGVAEVEIVSGLNVGDVLIPLSNTAIISGQKIRPLQPTAKP
jgi:HlyD family secretion protein